MLDSDVIKINNILLSSSSYELTIEETGLTFTYTTEKDYYDFALMILNRRKSTNITLNNFYNYSSTMGFDYNKDNIRDLNLFLMG